MAVLLSSRTWFSRPERSQPERTRREDRHSKFYEISDNLITEYVNVCRESRNCLMGVSSPTSRSRYRVTCHRTGGRYSGIVYCKAPAGTGIWARFSALI
jgi:hypothetical protein